MIHEIKVHPPYFNHIFIGIKNFEFRNDDRNYMVNDLLILKEFKPSINKYTGKELFAKITYKTNGNQFGIPKGYCILGITTAIDADEHKEFFNYKINKEKVK